MKDKTLQAYLSSNYRYDIIKGLSVNVDIERNPYGIPLDALFLMAARKNKKRSFLFVSKVLGKHIPVSPYTPLLAGAALAGQYMKTLYQQDIPYIGQVIDGLISQKNMQQAYEKMKKEPIILPNPVLFIGFAETATALGHAMFDCFGNATYIHTTRETIHGKKSLIEFEEEHSHATSHRFYPMDENILSSQDPVVLVDDEITTGKTSLNIIEAIQRVYPRREYVLVSLLDWRTKNDRHQFKETEERLGIKIHSVSLISGSIRVEEEWEEIQNIEEIRDLKVGGKSDVLIHRLWEEHPLEAIPFSSIDDTGSINYSYYLKETGRFGITSKANAQLDQKCRRIGESLKDKRTGRTTLCLGSGEFMFIPMKIASYMGEGISYHCTTRSPIYPMDKPKYGVKNGFEFESPEDSSIIHHLYNIPKDHYDEVFFFLERDIPEERIKSLVDALEKTGIPRIVLVLSMGDLFNVKDPTPLGSYGPQDVVFLLKDLSNLMEEKGTKEREEFIQKGTHYSEMLPKEYKPSETYMDLFYDSLGTSSKKLAIATGVVSEKIIEKRGKNLVLVSLARAGTPVGILIKRYIQYKYHMDLPHYSVSIIRGKGIDENAIRYILRKHPDCGIQFIDGWTGKGAITKVLTKACEDFYHKYGIYLKDDLAVLADPGHCVLTFGTREDFLIASACLNATVSGLVSRTVHRKDLIKSNDFHGAKYYKELEDQDVSHLFIDTVTEKFPWIEGEIKDSKEEIDQMDTAVTWVGWKDIEKIQREFNIKNVNFVKPGIGETTRVLLRRVPWKILIKEEHDPNLEHILLLARDRNVPIEVYPSMTYRCCGLIKSLRGK